VGNSIFIIGKSVLSFGPKGEPDFRIEIMPVDGLVSGAFTTREAAEKFRGDKWDSWSILELELSVDKE
jgi:hypothetical protein